MMKGINREVEIPEGVEVNLENGKVVVKKGDKKVEKRIPFSNKINIKKEGNKVVIGCKKPTRRESALAGTIEAHIRNAVSGIGEQYVYKLEICNVHFPMNVKADGKKLIIKNFLGEKVDRIAKILEGVELSVKGNMVELKSSDKDLVGQSAANIESATKVRNRDRRVFQDGIYLIEKGGKTL